MPVEYVKINNLMKFYLYGLQGLSTEIFYTAIWDFFASESWKLIGVSSIWAFIIYACSHMFVERIHARLIRYKVPIYLRGFVYLAWTYLWEFSTGYILSLFKACPWDYEPWFNWHVMGLITLEYAPLWYFGTLIAEQMIIPYVNSIFINNETNNYYVSLLSDDGNERNIALKIQEHASSSLSSSTASKSNQNKNATTTTTSNNRKVKY